MDVSGHTSAQQSPGDVLTDADQGAGAEAGEAAGPRPASIYDVAAAAGVSYQTVSRLMMAPIGK